MEPSLNKAMLGMTLEEDEEPYTIPDRPEFYSTERNVLSLVGRFLNPQCQDMTDLILDMPRKWQLYDRVRGVALSKDRFQFIFKYEHDLIDILNRGVHSSNQWSLAMERWVEKPPPDYLQFIEVWVQMRNIPVNHYTKAALTGLMYLSLSDALKQLMFQVERLSKSCMIMRDFKRGVTLAKD